MRYSIESKAAFNARHDIEGTAEDFLRKFTVTDEVVESDDKRGLEKTRRALMALGFKTTPVTADPNYGAEKDFYSSDDQIARELVKMAKSLVAVRAAPGPDPYSDDQKQQILARIPGLRSEIKSNMDDAAEHIEQAIVSMAAAEEPLEDLVWILGSSNDRDLRKSEMMLKSLVKHRETLDKMPDYMRRIGKWS